jgi:hypothetical protein|tara:strand:+ start:51 stop:578 length:528 start_codon:yes stop_codon:yes gene_type:complete
MKYYNLNYFYVITKVKEHKNVKKNLLKLINDMPSSYISGISKTDWHLSKETPRPYLDYFYKIISPYMNKMAIKMKCKDWVISNGWFQQYNKTDEHPWHNHGYSNFSNVYYIELPEKSIKTEFYDIVNNKVINTMKVKEGDMITFPSSLIHRSPKNLSSKRKSIISFNSNFEYVVV